MKYFAFFNIVLPFQSSSTAPSPAPKILFSSVVQIPLGQDSNSSARSNLDDLKKLTNTNSFSVKPKKIFYTDQSRYKPRDKVSERKVFTPEISGLTKTRLLKSPQHVANKSKTISYDAMSQTLENISFNVAKSPTLERIVATPGTSILTALKI